MSISSINTSSYTSEAVNNKPDPAQVKKASQQNQDNKSIGGTNTTNPVPVASSQTTTPTPSVNTSGQTVGQLINIKA